MNAAAKSPCTSCGAPLNQGARFCHACGAPQAVERKPLSIPLIAAIGFVVVVVVAIASYSAGRSAGSAAAPRGSSFSSGGGAAPDISSLSPREQADRLFEVVMTAHEQADFARVSQFAPMALQAYGLLGTLDPDAHYHVGLMSAITGDIEGASAQVDSMRSVVPNHLLATMLSASVAQMQGDSVAGLEAERKFLRDFDAEVATNRVEYQLHDRAIQNFRTRAQASVTGSS